ncbi:hypothetical protein [Streptomyces antimycoticus]|uniref:hypothetical protein n=1 Tax=Streptomyces antimycoticus TaxID=68175 RepID=UPI0036877E0A
MPRHVVERREPIVMDTSPLVRHFVLVDEEEHARAQARQQRERRLQQERRTALLMAEAGIDYPYTYPGAHAYRPSATV